MSCKALFLVLAVIFWDLLLPSQGQLNLGGMGIIRVVGDKQYFVETTAKVNWFRANQICSGMNMTLASIESAAEQINLKNLLYTSSALSKQYWLSGNDLPLAHEYVWFGNGKTLTYTSWANNRYNKNQHCVHTDSNFNWHRDYCSNQKYFICEKPLMPACGPSGECNFVPTIIY